MSDHDKPGVGPAQSPPSPLGSPSLEWASVGSRRRRRGGGWMQTASSLRPDGVA